MEALRRLPHALLFLARGAVTSVAGNVSLALLAAALGLSLWVFVTDQENPKEVQTFNSAIPVKFVNAPNDLAVASVSETSVRIRVEASKNDVKNLRAEDFAATVDLGGLPPGQNTLAVDVSPNKGNINVVDVIPPRLDVSLEAERTKEVPVRVSLVGSPQQGFAAVSNNSDPQSVTVTGPESLVDLVSSAVAEVNLTGQRVDVSESVELKPRDARGGEISRVAVNPLRAKVDVNIEQREFSAEFVVNPAITGEPASGYNITGISIDPRIVTLTGALEVLQSVDAVKGISTEEISVADARTDITRTVQLTLPPNVRVQGSPGVRVTVQVRAGQGEATFRVTPQVRNLGPGLAYTLAGGISVTLSGELPALASLTPESISASIDVQDLGRGLYAVPVSLRPPPGTAIVRSEPAEVGIAITGTQ
ncbi:MAG: hypothetical protein HYX50_01030 [Chloroflexi bacterium]|nr:hypothetical protein [Chloroflexota bacterium]